MPEEQWMKEGISAAKSGNMKQAAALFAQIVKENPSSERGWFLLGMTCSTSEQREYCLRRVLALNPGNQEAIKQLAILAKPSSPVEDIPRQTAISSPEPSRVNSFAPVEKREIKQASAASSYRNASDSLTATPPFRQSARMSSASVDEIVKKEMQEKRQQLYPDASPAQLAVGAVGGCMAAVVGAVVWAMIAYITGFQFSMVAIGVGLLVGFAVKMFNPNGGITSSIIGAILAMFGCLLGNYLAISVLIAAEFEVPVMTVASRLIFSPEAMSEVSGAMFGIKTLLFYIIAMGASFRTSA